MKNKLTFAQILNTISVILLAVFTLFPFYLMIATATKNQFEFATNFWGVGIPPTIKNLTVAWSVIDGYIFNSFKVTFLVVAGVLVVSILAGYAFAKMDFKFKESLYVVILAFKMIPITLILIPMFINVLNLGMNDTHAGVILPTIATAAIMPVILSRGFFAAIPDSIFESARIDGANELSILAYMVIPMSKPIIGTNALFTFFAAFNSYMLPYIVLSSDRLKTIPIGLSRLVGQYGVNYGVQMAAYAIICIPLMLLILSTMKVYVSGVTVGAVKE